MANDPRFKKFTIPWGAQWLKRPLVLQNSSFKSTFENWQFAAEFWHCDHFSHCTTTKCVFWPKLISDNQTVYLSLWSFVWIPYEVEGALPPTLCHLVNCTDIKRRRRGFAPYTFPFGQMNGHQMERRGLQPLHFFPSVKCTITKLSGGGFAPYTFPFGQCSS